MANYKVNEKSKTISVSGALTEIERGIISTYILNGYKVKEKREATAPELATRILLLTLTRRRTQRARRALKQRRIRR